ncbi:MAG: photosystem II reaction center phosphoprotein PsbH [Phormidesmis sp.]
MRQKFVSNKTAPLQYPLRKLNAESGKVVPGWGTAPLMGVLLAALLLFLLTILQLYNGTIMVEGIDI